MAARPLQPGEKVSLTSGRRAEVRRAVRNNKVGDKLLTYILWTLLAPGVATVLGAIGGVEAVKPAAIYAFSIGVVMFGIGELCTKGAHLHRFGQIMLLVTILGLVGLVTFWSQAADGVAPYAGWGIALKAIIITALVVGCDIVVGAARNAREEVESWVQ
jgi:hypothetical protein